ncbi:MAG: Dyp-type peroxidase family protein [Candidatus Eremiobacteraeota bacterium]|nr:Dyp-type peroxidase family protein [Candidatus Eremiobacteraeota bacterium]
MVTGQTGIFALGDAAHGFFEFVLREGAPADAFVKAVADLRPPHTTVGGVNLVVGFRPELWRSVAPDDAPEGVHGFDAELRGADGFSMPATQADLWVWYAAAAYDIVFDLGKATIEALAPFAILVRETTGWSYKHTRDLTGFEDGTENPTLYEAPEIALIENGAPGAGGSVLLFQQWRHHQDAWTALAQETQEHVIGRTKPDSIELEGDDMPHDSHVSRTKVVEHGDELPIFRRNVPYGTVTDHGTLFIGFSADQNRMHKMLEQMAGADGGPRDALTRYSTPLTGAYYFVPSVQSLKRFTTPEED